MNIDLPSVIQYVVASVVGVLAALATARRADKLGISDAQKALVATLQETVRALQEQNDNLDEQLVSRDRRIEHLEQLIQDLRQENARLKRRVPQ